MKKGFKVLVGVLVTLILVIVVFFFWITRPLEEPDGDFNPFSSEHLIAHGGGSIDGYIYTNSKEALLQSLDKGYKYIELDLYLTTDSEVVCLHSLKDFNKMTSSHLKELDSETFKHSLLYGRYTPMTLQDAIEIWESRPFYFVTDWNSSPDILNRYFKNHRERVVVEAFSPDDYADLLACGYAPMLSVVNTWVSLKRFIIASAKSKQLVKRIATREALVYLSDHGEMCYDRGDYTGRRESDLKGEGIHQLLDLPFLIWFSDKYKVRHQEIVDNVMRAVDSPMTSDNICHLLMRLGGVICNEYRDERDALSPNYKCPLRIVQTGINYDLR